MKPQSNIPDIPMATDGCHGAVTPDTPSIERLDSVSTPSPAPLSPGDQMDTSGEYALVCHVSIVKHLLGYLSEDV